MNINQNEELTNAEKREIKQEFKEKIKNEEIWNKDWISIEENITKEEKVRTFFDKIEFLWLENEQKEEVVLKVKADAAWDKLYWIEIFLSSTIAALWLIQNSVAVVIWAMLIAPLLRPINWVSFAIARWAHNFFLVSFKVLIISIFVSIFMWTFVSYLVWLEIETSEILARTSPNIIDFFIAIFSAMVAVMSLRFIRLWESIAWVAMAASLMPPLVVVWLELAMFNFDLAWGAMMLFLTNLVAIIIVWTIFFWLYWFTPHVERQQKHMYKWLSFVIISIIIISIPLVSSFIKIKENIKTSNDIKNYLNIIIWEVIDDFSISNIKIHSIKKDKISIDSTVKISEWVDIKPVLEKINWELSKKYWKTIEIDLEVIRVIKIISE
jgi:uncharacterized hydrophobic protein (TIGR00271 family)